MDFNLKLLFRCARIIMESISRKLKSFNVACAIMDFMMDVDWNGDWRGIFLTCQSPFVWWTIAKWILFFHPSASFSPQKRGSLMLKRGFYTISWASKRGELWMRISNLEPDDYSCGRWNDTLRFFLSSWLLVRFMENAREKSTLIVWKLRFLCSATATWSCLNYHAPRQAEQIKTEPHTMFRERLPHNEQESQHASWFACMLRGSRHREEVRRDVHRRETIMIYGRVLQKVGSTLVNLP